MYWLIPFHQCHIETPLNRQQALDRIYEVTVPKANPLLLSHSLSRNGNLFVGEVSSRNFKIQRYQLSLNSENVLITGITKPNTNQMQITFERSFLSNISPLILLVSLVLSLYLTIFINDAYKPVSLFSFGFLVVFQLIFFLEVRRAKRFLLELLQARECSF